MRLTTLAPILLGCAGLPACDPPIRSGIRPVPRWAPLVTLSPCVPTEDHLDAREVPGTTSDEVLIAFTTHQACDASIHVRIREGLQPRTVKAFTRAMRDLNGYRVALRIGGLGRVQVCFHSFSGGNWANELCRELRLPGGIVPPPPPDEGKLAARACEDQAPMARPNGRRLGGFGCDQVALPRGAEEWIDHMTREISRRVKERNNSERTKVVIRGFCDQFGECQGRANARAGNTKWTLTKHLISTHQGDLLERIDWDLKPKDGKRQHYDNGLPPADQRCVEVGIE